MPRLPLEYEDDPVVRILQGDCRAVLDTLPACSVHCVITSPPYWGLRDYGVDGQIGLEASLEAFIEQMVGVFRGVWRVLRDDGTLWLNLGDSYAFGGCGSRDAERWPKQSRNDHMATHSKKGCALKPKDLCGVPWRVALALQADGWYLRSDIIWSKPNPMPESVTDRPTKAHEYLFLLSKQSRYYYDADAVREPAIHAGETIRTNGNDGMCGGYDGHRTRDGFRRGVVIGSHRNRRTVWEITPQPFPGAHFATFPEKLVEPCILAGCPKGGTVLDPFGGAGTVGLVAAKHGRNAVLCELNPEYVRLAQDRLEGAPARILDC